MSATYNGMTQSNAERVREAYFSGQTDFEHVTCRHFGHSDKKLLTKHFRVSRARNIKVYRFGIQCGRRQIAGNPPGGRGSRD